VTIKELLLALTKLGACDEAWNYVASCSSVQSAWDNCPDSEWICWLFFAVGIFPEVFDGEWDAWSDYWVSNMDPDEHNTQADAESLARTAARMRDCFTLEEVLKALEEKLNA
jgi:hypothetical protein